MAETLKVIGLMSGTSLDGIDAALVETDGVDLVVPLGTLGVNYDAETRKTLRAALDDARDVAEGGAVPYPIRDAERRLTEAHADAVILLLRQAGLSSRDVSLIGFHGQTVLHRPDQRRSWQIGDGALLAKLTGVDVVNDFRSADMRAGGQGAPLVPLYHAALVRQKKGMSSPVVILNIGGVANVTYVDGDIILAFDTGPGNAPIDDWVQRHTGAPIDESGTLARTGTLDEGILARMLKNEFFDRGPPKSLDRMDFGFDAVAGLSANDGAATLTAFTAAAIARAREHFPLAAATWIVCGGGRHNQTLMAELRGRLEVPVLAAEDMGWNGDFVEAEAFAYLAARSLKGLPLSLPTTTGVARALSGGTLHRAK
jgi:anhydro-N-acetylmuramic acid kinase